MDKQGCLSGMGVWPLENDHSPEQEAGAGRWGGQIQLGLEARRRGQVTKESLSSGSLQSPGPRRPLKDESSPGL